jgi:glycosyltransferase involved in cell wall biosynthesis
VRVLVVSSYPPRHCGIGSYAAGQVERLRAEGHHVVVISPPDGRGDVRMSFEDGRPFLEAARRGAAFDRIVVHFEPGLYNRGGLRGAPSRILVALALLLLVHRRPQTEILVHEAHPPSTWRPEQLLLRRVFARTPLIFHTDAERRRLERDYRIRVRGRVVDHREGVIVRKTPTRDQARSRLRLDPTGLLFLCAGYLTPAKGYERAVRAFADSGSGGNLFIVGSVRDPSSQNLAYAARLRTLAARTDRVSLVETYPSDEEFDAWIAAADHVVLPYAKAWSSGVLARARVIGTPAMVSGVGGLVEQVGPDDVVFQTVAELRELFRRYGGAGVPARAVGETESRP